MAAIEVIVFAGAAGFAVIVVATILVIIGVRQEQAVLEREGRRTFAHHEPPTILALLARRVLGAHFNVMPAESPRRDYPKPNRRGPGVLRSRLPRRRLLRPGLPGRGPAPDNRPVWPEAG